MIVKTLGKKLIIDTKLYVLIHRLSPLCVFLSVYFFFIMAGFSEKSDFQQPSLRTTIYNYNNPTTTSQIKYLQDSGVIIHHVEGIISGQCLLVSFINTKFQKKLVSQLSNILQNERILSKTVLFVGYKTRGELENWISRYQEGETMNNFGVIRAGINLDLAQNGTSIFADFFGDNGRHSDADYHYYLLALMNKLRIKNRVCDSKIQAIKPVLSWLVKSQAGNAYTFINTLPCSLFPTSPHSVLLSRGIQSATLKSLSTPNEPPIKSTYLMLLLFSWIKQFSLQQDNLHSSQTLFYPTYKQFFIPVKICIAPYIIFIVAIVCYLLNQYLTKKRGFGNVEYRPIDALFLVSIISTVYYYPGMYVLGIFGLLIVSRVVHGERNQDEMGILRVMIILISMLTGVYNCIVYMPASIINYACTLLLMLPRQLLRVLVIAGCACLFYFVSSQLVLEHLYQMIDQSSVHLFPILYLITYILL